MRYFAVFYYFVNGNNFGTGTILCVNTDGQIVDDLFVIQEATTLRDIGAHTITLGTKVEVTKKEFNRLMKFN